MTSAFSVTINVSYNALAQNLSNLIKPRADVQTLIKIHAQNLYRSKTHLLTISIQYPVNSTHVQDCTENMSKICTVCVKITSFVNIACEQHKKV